MKESQLYELVRVQGCPGVPSKFGGGIVLGISDTHYNVWVFHYGSSRDLLKKYVTPTGVVLTADVWDMLQQLHAFKIAVEPVASRKIDPSDKRALKLGADAHKLLKKLWHSSRPLDYFSDPVHIEIVSQFLSGYNSPPEQN
jgi:hypothetical protein